VLEGVTVNEQPGEMIPLDLVVRDEDGNERTLGSFLQPRKPMVLNLGYYGCPMLCGLVLNGLTASVTEMGWTPGEQFTILSLSIDPQETPRLAREKKRNYINSLGQAHAAAGWHFLTADEAVSQAVADAVGFGYRYDPLKKQYVHPAVLVILMPDGRVSRYLYGIDYPQRTLRLSLIEAAEGKVGSTMDRVMLTCFEYDPATGSYRVAAMSLMRLAGAVTVIVVAGLIGSALLRERRRRGRASAA
jgi:protein SCO1/2